MRIAPTGPHQAEVSTALRLPDCPALHGENRDNRKGAQRLPTGTLDVEISI